jgi:hypothetical protein
MTSRIPGAVNEPLGADVAPAFNTGHSTGIEVLEELGVHKISSEKTPNTKEKGLGDDIRRVSSDEEAFGDGDKLKTAAEKVDNMEEIAIYALHTDDDVSLNPWTFRTMFLGMSQPQTGSMMLTFNRHRTILLFRCPCNHLPI